MDNSQFSILNYPLPMRLALDEAWKYQFLTYPNPAVGACVVGSRGAILSVAAHKEAGAPHAEVLALKAAYQKLTNDDKIEKITDAKELHEYLSTHHNGLFRECALYVTLEPCNHYGKTPPCTNLIANLGIKRVIIGAMDTNKEASGGAEYLKSIGVSVESGVMKKECDELLEPFVIWQGGVFVIFKWAQRLDGTIDGGYISCLESLKLVHAIRSKIDLLLIGGNTVRTDRPTLDSRFVGGRAPDVAILSKSGDFDKSIPLFGVPNRSVRIGSSIDLLLPQKGLVMVEGGVNLLKTLSDKIGWYMGFIALVNKKGTQMCLPNRLKLLKLFESGEDIGFYARTYK